MGIVFGSIAGCCLLGVLCTWIGQKLREKLYVHDKKANEFEMKYVKEEFSIEQQS